MQIELTHELLTTLIAPVSILLLILILWWMNHRHQKESIRNLNIAIQELDSEVDDQKQLIQIQMQDITTQMISNATLQESFQNAEKQVNELKQNLLSKDANIESLNKELSAAKSNISELQTRMAEERKAAFEKLALLDDAKHKLSNEFKLLANEIFDEKSKVFSEKNRTSLDEVLVPMRQQLGDFRKRVDEVHLNDAKDRASLKEHLTHLEGLNRKMSEDALSLTQALKGESKSQGNWGEMILERILETSGLREGHEFAREQSFTTDDGKRLRPDVVVYMPGNKQVIIDSKVSLTDYERAVSANDAVARKIALTAHLKSLKNHIQSLSSKRYEHLPNVHSPDYVLMFMPIEGAYLMAIEADPSIFESAFEQRVAVVTPSTLYATLKLIERLWRNEKQSENVVKLIDRASKLHDKMVDFVKAFEEIGGRLGQAQMAYDTASNRMSSGAGNVIGQIATMGKLAGKTKKELPKHLIGMDSKQASIEEESAINPNE